MDKSINKDKLPNLSNSFSTGGGGVQFEYCVQAMFLLTLVVDGFSPVLNKPVKCIVFQGKRMGYDIDDVIIETETNGLISGKLHCQIKHDITISKGDLIFKEVLRAAWSDFTKETFDKTNDKIALVTGFISKETMKELREIHEKAVFTDSPFRFFSDIETPVFTSRKIKERVELISEILKEINSGQEISQEELWMFFRVFVLLIVDLDYKNHVNESLIKSLIKASSKENPNNVWAKLFQFAAQCDKLGATITIENFDRDILSDFKIDISVNDNKTVFNSNKLFSRLLVLGSWDENNINDIKMVEEITGSSYKQLKKEIQDYISEGSSYISLNEGVWTINERVDLFNKSKKYYFDDDIEEIFSCAKLVFEQNDKRLSANGEYSYMIDANEIYDNSQRLRKSLAQGLCILANEGSISNCSSGKVERTAYSFIRDLFEDSSWLRWASLSDFLQIIAEISPESFLKQLEKYITKDGKEILRLFPQGSSSFMQPNYSSGIMWSLECLAWSEKTFISAIRCLCELASLNIPKSNYANNPLNSLTSILLPWHFQTKASIQTRKNAIRVALREFPDVGWKLLKAILPGGTNTTTGTCKPKYFAKIDKEIQCEGSETQEMYNYALQQSFDVAKGDAQKLSELIHYFYYMSSKTVEKYLDTVESGISKWGDEDKFKIWLKLNDFKYQVLLKKDEEKIPPFFNRMEGLIESLKPDSLIVESKRLFLSRFDEFTIEEHKKDRWEAREKKKAEIVKELYKTYTLQEIKSFGKEIKKDYEINFLLGKVISLEDIQEVVDAIKEESDFLYAQQVLYGYLKQKGNEGLNDLNLEKYEKEFIAKLLHRLPLSNILIEIVGSKLAEDEKLYWESAVMPRICQSKEDYDVGYVIDKLIKYDRYATVVNMIYHEIADLEISNDKIMDILEKASITLCVNKLDDYAVQRLIKYLQDQKYDKERLSTIEFYYLPWLSHHSSVQPRALREKIAFDYKIFCDFMQLYYKKRNSLDAERPELNKQMIERLSELLFQFDIVPGVDWDGEFHPDVAKNWIEKSIEWATANDRVEVVQQTIGGALAHAKVDADGLIDESLIEILDARHNEEMRRGFMIGIFNKRGVHFIDPEGKPEKELCEKYNKSADIVEQKGFSRFSGTLRSIADDYLREAERNIREYCN